MTAKRNLLLEYSEELAIKIAKLCNEYKVDSNTVFQIKKSSSSIFANIAEAQYPQSLADMHSKLEIARKECAGTGSWLKLIFASGSIDEQTFKNLRNLFGRIKRILTASCITIENKSGLSHLSITEKNRGIVKNTIPLHKKSIFEGNEVENLRFSSILNETAPLSLRLFIKERSFRFCQKHHPTFLLIIRICRQPS